MGANLGNTKAALDSYGKAMAMLDSAVQHDPENRKAQIDRLVVQRRIGAVYMYTEDSKRALASLRDAEKVGEDLLSRHPDDEQVAIELAHTYVAAGGALSIASGFAASIEENTKAVTLLQRFSATHPEDRELKQTLADAYSAIGVDQTRLGALKDALDQYGRALSLLQQLAKEDPGQCLVSACAHRHL